VKEREQDALRRIIEEQSGKRQALPMVRARVVRADSTSGGKADLLTPRYTVDVQPVRRDGEDDPDWPVLPEVEVSVLAFAGPGRGIYGLPRVGSLVRVGFYYNDAAQPYVDAPLAYGWDVPAVAVDELVIAVSGSVGLRLREDGIEVFGPVVKVGGATALMRCLYTGSDHPALPIHITSPG